MTLNFLTITSSWLPTHQVEISARSYQKSHSTEPPAVYGATTVSEPHRSISQTNVISTKH